MNKIIRTLTITFDLPIYARQIRRWRAAFIEMGAFGNDLFHNHQGDNYHYRYPLIQYRQIKGNAGLVAINEGVEALQEVLAANQWVINWEGEKRAIRIEDIKMRENRLEMLDYQKKYKIEQWLALNQENYKKWLKCPDLISRIQLLEGSLTGQLLGFCTSMDFQLPERLETSILHIDRTRKLNFHGTSLVSFNTVFSANLALPPWVGIGKATSHGFGGQRPFIQRHIRPTPTLSNHTHKEQESVNVE